MSFGKLYLSSIVKSGNRTFLNRVKPELLFDKPSGGDALSERQIFDFIRNHVLSYRVLPSPTVLQSSGIPYIETDQPPEYYLQEIKKRAVYVEFKKFYSNINPLLQNDFNLDKAFELITSFGQVVSNINVSDQYKSMADLGRDIEAEIEYRKNGGKEVFIPFGWPTADALTGGAAGGDLVYIVGRPGMGKSNTLAFNSHHAWTQGYKPLLLTMEMTDVQISRRIFGLQGQFNSNDIRRGIPDAEVERRLKQSITAFEQGPDFNIICGQVRQTVDTVAALIDELKPDVVYIDAAYLLKMNGPTKLLWEKIAAIGEQLKQIAITRDIPIIQTVQFNRQAGKGNQGSLENIAGSDAISQLGSIIMSITPGEQPYEENRKVIHILKNREGGVANFTINSTFDPPNFSEVSALADSNLEEEEEIIL